MDVKIVLKERKSYMFHLVVLKEGRLYMFYIWS